MGSSGRLLVLQDPRQLEDRTITEHSAGHVPDSCPLCYRCPGHTMDTLRTLTQDQFDALLRDGEFPEDVRLAAPKVVVVMTQDWCGQWADMAGYLPDFATEAAIFTVEYNRRPDFERIMRFKEDVLGNHEVPYVRFYRDGTLVRQSNWLPRASFAALLRRP
jgi:hypothetical protein